MAPRTLDHVAFWVADRDAIVERLLAVADVRVIEQTDRFTLVGADARRGKLTFFDAEGPRDRGMLKHVALRVHDGDESEHDLGEGLVLRLVPRETDVDYDLDSVALFSHDAEATARAYVALGFTPAGRDRVAVGGKFVEFHANDVDAGERPLLNHIGVLVDRADEAKALGVEVADVVDAPNTYAVFVWGPERVKIEYIEHKPTFALR